jgi:hypothetical protein
LLHDQLDVLSFQPGLILLLSIILLLFLLGIAGIYSLALVSVVVARMFSSSSLCVGDLLSGGSLSSGVEIFNLGLAEDATARSAFLSDRSKSNNLHPGIAGRRLVDIGIVDDEQNLHVNISFCIYEACFQAMEWLLCCSFCSAPHAHFSAVSASLS